MTIWGGVTRSGLFFEALRIIKDTKPKYAIAENVKALTSKKFTEEFMIVLSSLKDAGYHNYFKVLNAKDFGIPQNRERVFIVSIREDIDDGFVFPKEEELKLKLKDILEQSVSEEYYLKHTKQFFINNSLTQESRGNGFRFAPYIKNNAHIAKTITTKSGARMDDNFILDNNIGTSDTTFVFNKKNKNLADTFTDLKIRKLTPTECWRLMGFTDEDINKCIAVGISNSQLYKQAGNSIVVNVLKKIFTNLLK